MFWNSGRFNWPFVLIVLFTTLTVIMADIFWRTIHTSALILGLVTAAVWSAGIALAVVLGRKLNNVDA